MIIRPWDPSSLQYNLAAGRFYCILHSELTLTYTRIKNALRKFVFALIDFSKFEDLNCFAPCDRSPNFSATNFPPNFGQICTARYPMISEWPPKKMSGVEYVEIVPHRRGICANVRNPTFSLLRKSTVARNRRSFVMDLWLTTISGVPHLLEKQIPISRNYLFFLKDAETSSAN